MATEETSSTRAVAEDLVRLCREGREQDAIAAYYHPDLVSVEAFALPGMERELRGIAAVERKHAWWNGAFEVHGGSIEGPFVNGDRFATFHTLDCTDKESGQRMTMTEVAVYTVADGKIVHEAFFAKPSDCG
jgi:ketosteroid isomerase-like protein